MTLRVKFLAALLRIVVTVRDGCETDVIRHDTSYVEVAEW